MTFRRRHAVILWVLACSCLVGRETWAEQQVTLQSGAVIIGVASMDGDEMVVEVDGAKLRVPFNQVAMIASADGFGDAQANRLLIRALEARALQGQGRELGLLAEAYRLAPNDPRIAYWYVVSMAEAGYGKGAEDVFNQRRKAIAEVYPDQVSRLEPLIKEKKRLESLPTKLIKRIDQLEQAADNPDFAEDGELRGAYFQLVDQNGRAIPAEAYRISCNGNNERTELFDDGYVLFTFQRHRSSDPRPCRIEFQLPDYREDGVEFSAHKGGGDAGTIVVYRYGDADRVEAVVNVANVKGEPMAGVEVNLRPSRGGSSDAGEKTTDKDGSVRFRVYPGKYVAQGVHKGYNRSGKELTASSAEEAEPTQLTMHELIQGKARVEWRMRVLGYPGAPGGAESVSLGEADLSNDSLVQGPYGPNPPWLRFVQQGDKLQLQFMTQPYYPNALAGNFLGRLKSEEKVTDESPNSAEEFKSIDLAKLDELKPQLEIDGMDANRMRGRPTLEVDVEEGAIYVGRISSREMQSGRPAEYEFKVLVSQAKLAKP